MSLPTSKFRMARKDPILSRPILRRPGGIDHSGQPRLGFDHGNISLKMQRTPPSRPQKDRFDPNDKTLLDENAHPGEDNQNQQKEELEASTDDEDFDWDEEQSLLLYLMDEGPRESEEDRLDALAESLQAPFDEKRKQLRKEMVDTFIPAVRHVKTIHQILEERVDISFGEGIARFNAACKDMEAATLAEYEELTEAYEKSHRRIAGLMLQLKAEYAHRDQLWVDLEHKINEIVDPTVASLEETPARVERSIAKLEKHYQSLENDSKDSNIFAAKRLKELISKLG